jgi:GAF domain-containing protein
MSIPDFDKGEQFSFILGKVEGIASDPDAEQETKLARICSLLKEKVAYYDWVGFYIADNQAQELELGPFAGEPTDHVRIPFGKGICGQTAVSKETFLVPDVTKEDNYLSCSADVRSEIVVPVIKDGEFVAELDIDSRELDPFSKADEELLNAVCDMLSGIWE